MSTTIDQNVVEMRFDNRHFEENVSTSMSTLDKLKQSLNLNGAAKGLENIDDAAKNCDVSALGRAAETVGLKFNAMYTIADQTLRRITDSALYAGKRIISALTIDPVRMGFSEYETQMNAVQTILANTESKGKTLEDVNSALDELNAYADKTIYNFTEMTRNIGTFTAAGVDLDTSVSAIKGIANLAAVSGSTSQQASTAMYQLSQALASGTVKLMDWNSVVNAGMGGQVFQDALKETAKVHGVAIDDIIAKQGSFRESLSEGWLTSEILTETLSKFTGDLTEDQLKSMGYTDEQIKNIIKLGNTANDAATKVKTFTQLFDTLKEAAQSGWTQTWEILVGDFEEAKELLTSISDTIGEMIGNSAEARNELLENWKVLGGRDDLIESFKNIWEGLLSIIKPIKEAFREIFPPTTAEKLAGFTKGFKELTEKFKLSDSASDKLKRTFKGIFAILDIVKQAFFAVAKAVGSLFGIVGDLCGGILGVTAYLGDWVVNLDDAIKSSDIFNKVLKGIADVIKLLFSGFKNLFKVITEKLVFPGVALLLSLLERIRERFGGVGDAARGMKSVLSTVFDSISSALESSNFYKFLSAVWKGATKFASAIGKIFGAMTTGLIGKLGDADFTKIFDFINGIIAGGVGIGLIRFINSLKDMVEGLSESFGGFKGFFEGMKGILDEVRGCFETYQKSLKADILMKIAKAIALLTAAIFVLSLIDSDKLGVALAAMTATFIELMSALAVLGKLTKMKGVFSLSVAMMALSTALLVLSVALKIMSTMSWGEMGRGLVAMTVGLGLLVAAVNLLPESKVTNAARAIKKMATAILILSLALKIMSTLSWGEIGRGLVAMTIGLGLFVVAVNLLPESKVTNAARSIEKMAMAILILSLALKIMATMSWGDIARGLVTTVVGLAALVGAVNLLPKDMGLRVIGMISLATAMVILAAALKIMASMSWEQVGIGLATLAGSLTILAIALNLMNGTLAGSAALLVAAMALALLVPTIVILGSLSWETIIKGLVAIAAALAIVGVAGAVLLPYVPAILALAGAIALIGVGTLAAGLGLMAFGAGLSLVAVGLTALVASLGAVVTGIIAIVSAIVTGIIKGVGEGIVALCEVIIEAVPVIAKAIAAIIVAICDAIIEAAPKIIEAIGVVLSELLKFLISFIPKLVDAGMKIVVGVLQGIAKNIGDVVAAGADIVIAFIKGIGSQSLRIIQAAMDMIIDFINGLANAIRQNTQRMIDAIDNLMDAMIDAAKAWAKHMVQVGKDMISGLIKGMLSLGSAVVDAAKDVAKKAWKSVKNFLGIKSPSRKFIELGKQSDRGLAIGLKKYAGVVEDAAVDVGHATTKSLSNAVGRISDIIDSDMDTQPTIRPVLDLTDVKSGANDIDSMFDVGPSVGVLANVGSIGSMMNSRGQNGTNDDVVSELSKLRKELGKVGNTSYNINGVTYDDGSNIADAVKSIVRAARVERRA